MSKNKVTGIILAAGNSLRFKQQKNKNLFKLNGKAIIEYSIEIFNNCTEINDIILVIKQDEKKDFEEIINKMNIVKPFKYVYGGNTRKDSVCNALKETNSDIVLIHDGARPKIKEEYIYKCLEEMKNFKGVTIGVKSKDTIKVCDDFGVIVQTTKRANTYIIQTPQCFYRDILLQLHEKIGEDESITDDCMLLENSGYAVKVIEGDYTNIKVTTFDDIHLVE